MRFGPVPLDEALGAVLAHSHSAGGRRIGKGVVLGAAEIAALAAEGLTQVTVARLDPGDLDEDTAAARLAAALAAVAECDPGGDPLPGLVPRPAPGGRVNLNATAPGVLAVDAARIEAINAVDPAITLATLAPLARVTGGMLAATVKIIPYGVPADRVAQACALAPGALRLHRVTARSAALVLTELPGQGERINVKARAVTEARLTALGVPLTQVLAVPHSTGPLAAALAGLGADLVLILTASATSDLHDVAPEAVRRAGGRIERFGMPVDPGNLLFLGDLGGRPVLGLPGCARSPALNGADWVLERVACGLPVGSDDIARMGVGGLLKEIPTRPQPREARRRGV